MPKSLKIKSDFWIFLVVLTLLSLFMVCWCGPLSVYTGDDYYFHLMRFETLIKALGDGHYPIYIDYSTLEGYGYFTKAFYPDLVLVPFALIAMFTGSVLAYNIMIFSFTLLCGLFMYYAVNTIFKSAFVASISSIVYTFSVYHLYDWYNRAALAESISFTFLPLVFLGVYFIIIGDFKKWYVLTIGYSLLIYTHLLSSVMTFMIIAALLLIGYKSLIKEPKRILYLLLAAIATLLVTVSYLLPMIEQMLSNTFYYSIYPNTTNENKESLLEMAWGALNGVVYKKGSLKLANVCGTGILPLILISLRLFVREKTQSRKFADICLIIGIFLLFMISSFFPWGILPLGFIQFPWRFYEFVMFFFAIAGAYYLSALIRSNKQRIVAGSAIVVLSAIFMIVANNNYVFLRTWIREWNFLSKEKFVREPSPENSYHLVMHEYLPRKISSVEFIKERGDSVNVLNTDTEISKFVKKEGKVSFDVTVNSEDTIELPLVYYKGYEAILNKETIPISESSKGLLQIAVNKSGKVEVYYKGTFIQRISWVISLLSVLVLCVYIFYVRKNRLIETK